MFKLSNMAAESKGMDERRVKIGYMYNFLLKSVSWPCSASPRGRKIGDICIVGDMKLGNYFKTIIENTPSHGFRVNLEYCIDKGNISDCHILFIGAGASGRLSHILEKIRNRPILTVSDVKGFANKGGMIEFVKVKHNGRANIRTRLDIVSAEENNITLAPELILLSDIVEKKELAIITDQLH